MSISLLSSDEQTALQTGIGDLSQSPQLAEQLFAELSARGHDTRYQLCRRLVSRLTLLKPSLDEARALLDVLIDQGDITGASGGRIAATPIRAISLGGDRYLIRCSLPSTRLSELLKTNVTWAGLSRGVTLPADELSERLTPLDGVMLSAATWAGLHRAPPAGPTWLTILNERLPSQQVDLGIEISEGWKTYLPGCGQALQARRWRPDPGIQGNHLWRCRHIGGWWVYAWTSGMHPHQAPAVRVSTTEAIRAAFSLDLTETPLTFVAIAKGAETVLRVDAMLPVEEYRYLTTIGSRQSTRWPAIYQFSTDTWPEVAATLKARLGVHLDHREG